MRSSTMPPAREALRHLGAEGVPGSSNAISCTRRAVSSLSPGDPGTVRLCRSTSAQGKFKITLRNLGYAR